MGDLTHSERIALKEHLAMCSACYEVHMDYQTLEASIRSLLVCEEAAFISQPRSQRVRRSPRSEIILPDILSLSLSMFASLIVSIYLSNIYLKLHYWLLLIPSLFSRKIAYVTSSNHYLYAIRSESGFMVWQQKRFQKQNTLNTVPVYAL
jgi:Putative zinc-finger